jgi:hypothetical protein
VDGNPVMSVPRTLLDLAEVSDAKGLRRAYEETARLEALEVRALERVLARARGRRGLAPLRDLLAYDPAPVTHTRSELERLLLDLVRDAGCRHPRSTSWSTAAARRSNAITPSTGDCGSRGTRSWR